MQAAGLALIAAEESRLQARLRKRAARAERGRLAHVDCCGSFPARWTLKQGPRTPRVFGLGHPTAPKSRRPARKRTEFGGGVRGATRSTLAALRARLAEAPGGVQGAREERVSLLRRMVEGMRALLKRLPW